MENLFGGQRGVGGELNDGRIDRARDLEMNIITELFGGSPVQKLGPVRVLTDQRHQPLLDLEVAEGETHDARINFNATQGNRVFQGALEPEIGRNLAVK